MNVLHSVPHRVHAPSCRRGPTRLRPVRLQNVRALLGLVCLIALSGCGYSVERSYPEAVRSVSVPIFENRTPWRELEFQLAEALKKEIEQRTPYKVTATNAADTILQGRISQVRTRNVSDTETGGLPQEVELAFRVDFEWKDLQSGELIRHRSGLTRVARFIPTRPVGETVEVAHFEVARRMAEAIVLAMRSDWE